MDKRIPGRVGDRVIFLAILGAALLALAFRIMIFRHPQGEILEVTGPGTQDRIRVDSLPRETGQIWDISGAAGGLRLIYLPEKGFYVESAACPDQVCVHSGYINKAGQSIVCVPNKVTIRLLAGGGEGDAALDGILR